MKAPETMEKQRKHLQRWLAEWQLDRALGDPSGSAPELWRPRIDFSAEPCPAPGHIRLWPARSSGDEPCYGLLLSGGYGRWRVLPFSGFSLPATPGEWRLRREGPLRVLQIWNLREINGPGAATSWWAETVPTADLFPLEAYLTAWKAGEIQESTPPEQVGPPLIHPLDPRHEYLEMEFERVDRALGELEAAADPGPGLDLAAESPPEYPDP